MKDKTYKAIMVGYTENHTHDTYQLYNTEINRVIMSRYIKQLQRKKTDPAETMTMFRDLNEKYLLPGKEEAVEQYITHMSNPEDPLAVHVTPDEIESARTNDSINSSKITYPNKYTGT